jgi:chromosome segregation ATPase
MMEISRSNKEFMGNFGDIIFKAQDWPGADKISERFKKMLPPELKEDETDIEKQKANLQQAAQMLGQKEAEVNAAIEQIQEQGQAISEQEENAKEAMLKVQSEIEKLNTIQASIENERALFELQKKLAQKEIQIQSTTLESDKEVAEKEMEVLQTKIDVKLKELAETSKVVEKDAVELKNSSSVYEEILKSLLEVTALAQAPRETQLITDDLGNPVGSISKTLQ